eukprot:scaffold1.g5178.t1
MRPLPPGLVPPRPEAPPPGAPLVLMVLDVAEAPRGGFHVWGSTPGAASVLVRVLDFQPHFWVAAPSPAGQADGDAGAPAWDAARLAGLRDALNRAMPPDARLAGVEAHQRRPVMYYRPDNPGGSTFLKLCLHPGGSVRKASAALAQAIARSRLPELGLVWRDPTVYEAEVNPLQRFLVDVPVSGGAWLYVAPPLAELPPGSPGLRAPHTPGPGPPQAGGSSGAQLPAGVEGRVSGCDIEVVAPWRSIRCLTPDATQLANPGWSPLAGVQPTPPPPEVAAAAAAAVRGELVPLRVLVLDVLCGTGDGADRTPVPERDDPVVAIACMTYTLAQRAQHAEACAPGGGAQAAAAAKAPDSDDTGLGGGDDDEEGEQVLRSAAAVAGLPSSTRAAEVAAAAAALPQRRTALLLLSRQGREAAGPTQQHGQQRELEALEEAAVAGRLRDRSGVGAASVMVFGDELELLLTWLSLFRRADPDVIAVFQVRDTVDALQRRFHALLLEGGRLRLCRMLPAYAAPLGIKRVTQYSAAWFTLADCVQNLLGRTLEVLRPYQLSRLAGVAAPPQPQQQQQRGGLGFRATAPHSSGAARTAPHKLRAGSEDASSSASDGARSSPGPAEDSPPSTQLERAIRLGRYARRRMEVVAALLARLAVLPETVELARATGLTLGQIAYNAQMIRVGSLLLRACQRAGFVVPGRQEAAPLTEHTFILHPVEAGTVGLYQHPVAILDFASLYPSLYRAYNLCYSTLLHPQDVSQLPQGEVEFTPTGTHAQAPAEAEGAAFVRPTVREGILPSILAALMAARAMTREQLKGEADPAARAVLDCRQKALKVTANALYGFNGAGASPLQCVPLADSCLALGAAACRQARQVLEQAAAQGRLGPHGAGARVVYGHTDSLFVELPSAPDVAAAIAAARAAARAVSEAFPAPMELKLERVYAGKAFESEADVAAGGELIVKGIRSMWRQAAPIMRTTLHGALVRIIMQGDVEAAVRFVEGEVLRLLLGRVDLGELVMTGGLWRVTGEQVEAAAAAEEGAEEELGGGGVRRGAPAASPNKEQAEDLKGPHVVLAKRLKERDPGRLFVLGERLPYVLMAGEKKQDDAAEDPLAVAREGRQGGANFELRARPRAARGAGPGARGRLVGFCAHLTVPRTPLRLMPDQQELLSGAHTRFKVDSLTAAAPLTARLGPSAASAAAKSKGGQRGLASFFQVTAKCLGCKRAMPGAKGSPGDAPGLCDSCASTDGKWETTYAQLAEEAAVQEAQLCAAQDACRQCHSGVLSQPVLCLNGECPVLYARFGAEDRLRGLVSQLRRLDIY